MIGELLLSTGAPASVARRLATKAADLLGRR
jgi:hypothetical protein